MDDLDNSPLFDEQHLRFLSSLLSGRTRNAVTGAEISFARKKTQLLALDALLRETKSEVKSIQGYEGLLAKLTRFKNAVSVRDCTMFLLEAVRYNVLKEGLGALEFLLKEDREANLQDLITILEDTADMPVGWAVMLHSEETEGRVKRATYSMPSGLNLNAMNNFK